MRRFAPLLPLPLLLALGAWGSARVAEHAGGVVAGMLSGAAGLLTPPATPEDDDEELGSIPATLSAPVEAPPPPAAKGRRTKHPAPAHAVFVSADTVLRVASTRVRLRGVPVSKDGARPAGLRLAGVSALGVGLADGDVLTRALGAPALSRSEVVRAVLVARARHDKVLEGEFYRGSERWVLRVEQPYPPEPNAAVETSTAAQQGERVASR